MPKPLLEPNTERKLQRVIASPPHALLLTGPPGMGKATVAQWLAQQLHSGPHVLTIESVDGKAIGIEAVRELEHFVALKLAAKQGINRLVLLYDAHLLTTEAQNAMLKTLEEPPAGTLLLLTSSQQESLLPTIRSRVQVIDIQKPAASDLKTALGAADSANIMALSGGLPGLAFALANNQQDHSLVQAAQTARQLLQSSTFEKLTLVDKLAKDKQQQGSVIYILMQMAHAALLTGRGTERWQKVLQAAYQAESDTASGAQAKLALTKLMLSL